MILKRALERRRLAVENRALKESAWEQGPFDRLVGKSPAMQRLYRDIEKVAPSDATVLLYGESGTGKELVAHSIHARSARRGETFVAVNASALPESLAESELFGHEKGAFTGAIAAKPGRFELAHRGTLFLDEIGTLSAAVQAKLLRAIESLEVERVGGRRSIPVDFRLISATNEDLEARVAEGAFRQDLFYRINTVPIRIPPLRERPGDIPFSPSISWPSSRPATGSPAEGFAGCSGAPRGAPLEGECPCARARHRDARHLLRPRGGRQSGSAARVAPPGPPGGDPPAASPSPKRSPSSSESSKRTRLPRREASSRRRRGGWASTRTRSGISAASTGSEAQAAHIPQRS